MNIKELKELEKHLHSLDLKPPITLRNGAIIVDIDKYLSSEFEFIKFNFGINNLWLPAFDRLKSLKKYIKWNY